MKPVLVIDKAIELVDRRDGSFADFGSWTKGHEVVQEDPGTDVEFGRAPIAMEMT